MMQIKLSTIRSFFIALFFFPLFLQSPHPALPALFPPSFAHLSLTLTLPPFSRHPSGLFKEMISLLLSLQDSRVYVAYDVLCARACTLYSLASLGTIAIATIIKLLRITAKRMKNIMHRENSRLLHLVSCAAADRQRQCAKARVGRRKSTRQEILLNKGYGLEYHSLLWL